MHIYEKVILHSFCLEIKFVIEADNQVQLPKNISSALNSPSSHVEITSSGKKVHGKRKSADMIGT